MSGSGGAPGSARGSLKLPSGRHGLSRSFVAENQRGRILAAVAAVTSDLGYSGLTVETIIAAAGVSRRTFYEFFRNKEDAFLAAYDDAVVRLSRRLIEAMETGRDPMERLRGTIGGYLGFVAEQPELARMCIVEVLAAGSEAIRRRDAAMRAFSQALEPDIRELFPGGVAPELRAEMIVEGVYGIVYTRVLQGRIGELPGLLEGLLHAVLSGARA
ncbi:TetR/AcrR family transcriptional regulator [Bailinhaonella thermotolerans]|uniref:TetR/AcrR family transcriptional regulator n=1 Tax=Bailinhaonella thermotolerans TaxID=1070861 RepID=A0A3A4A524_9ACTN|nr:TetR/AcrR family transcriptional regulator [Bailinhaonella thermotolerans]RJL20669.1 TetR/AcrR family transcriptional regulator [Bailinhaonella thermotolerans]